MKKIFTYILVFFIAYIHIGHNSAIAFVVHSEVKKEVQDSCHNIHTKPDTHKCCFISQTDNKTIILNSEIPLKEKTKNLYIFPSIEYHENIKVADIFKEQLYH